MPIWIESGLADDIVLQRNARDTAGAAVRGRVSPETTAPVKVTVYWKEAPLEGFDAEIAGQALGGNWSAILSDLPVGGPYEIEFAIEEERARVRGVLVGDLWILAGQSNMEGCGDLVDVEPPSPYVHVFDMADRWHIAEEPLHWLVDSQDACHCETRGAAQRRQQIEARRTRTKGAGLGLPFANAMVRETGIPIGLIACAHGGTSMHQWSPNLKHLGGGSLYGSVLRRLKLLGGRVAGVLWYQGESDANMQEAPKYLERMQYLIANIRKDLQAPRLPFYIVQIGRVIPPEEWTHRDMQGWNLVQDSERRLAEMTPHTGLASAIDLELDDRIHIGTQGLKRLGERLAYIALSGEKGLRPASVVVEGELRNRIRIAFHEVAEGGFEDSLRVTGFTIHKPDGSPVPYIYKAQVDPENPQEILLDLIDAVQPGMSLWHGWGYDPPCNLVDSEDMAVPVFGPILL